MESLQHETKNRANPPKSLRKRNFNWPYGLLVVAVLAQVTTVIITWPLWQTRTNPPHLPVLNFPQIPFGVLILCSLAFVLIRPRFGFAIHCLVMVVASLFDQFRLQPQILAIAFLMLATLGDVGLRVSRWFLTTLWIWAGVHKLLSPHWFTFASHWLVNSVVSDSAFAENSYWIVAWGIAVAEITVGIAAILWTRAAAFLCFAMHISIFVLLILIHWNFSVLPWNLSTAIVGFWIMQNSASLRTCDGAATRAGNFSIKLIESASAAIFFVAPVGFYWGYVDHGYASVLYSEGTPRGLITRQNGLEYIQGWEPINVPFPCERRTLLQFFSIVARDGEKLHILDPRPALADQFFVFRHGKSIEIEEAEFFYQVADEVCGVSYDERVSVFWLSRWGEFKFRWYRNQPSDSPDNAIRYAYTVNPKHYSSELVRLLKNLKNLEQLQMADCPVQDADLIEIGKLKNLTGIGLNNTAVTDAGIMHLSGLAKLEILEAENTQVSPQAVIRLQAAIHQ